MEYSGEVWQKVLDFKELVDLLIITEKVPKKCSAESKNAREQGNELYAKRNHEVGTHKKILSLYNKSIAFAEKDSEELAVAYSNRSALLLHIDELTRCLKDIERASKITKSEILSKKLHSRKMKCLTRIPNLFKDDGAPPPIPMEEYKNPYLEDVALEKIRSMYRNITQSSTLMPEKFFKKKLELPEITRSVEIPSFAESISWNYNSKWGRHIIANRDITPGSVIAIEDCYLVQPKNELYLVCTHCLEIAWNGIPCDFCTFTIYCSDKCKKEAWIMYHDIECSFTSALYSEKLKNMSLYHVKAAFRLFISIMKKEGFKTMIEKAKKIDENFAC